MISSNLDELTKALATSTSRRQTIRILFASALGSMISVSGLVGMPQAEGCSIFGDLSSVCGTDTDCGIWTAIKARVADCENNPMHCSGIDPHSPARWVVYPYETGHTNYTMFAADQRITGIECPKIWQMGAPNYWEFAWNVAKIYLPSQVRAGIIGLAINSKSTRTECQLHIHVSCIQTNVKIQLNHYFARGQIAQRPTDWGIKIQPLMYEVKGSPQTRNFRLLYLNNLSQNLFQLLHNDVVSPNSEQMADQTLIVTEGPHNGFYIMNSMPGLTGGGFGGTGAGEELLNENC